jgi:hypothetical protein
MSGTVCPHSARVLRNDSQIPARPNQDRCDVCWQNWFGVDENGAGGIVVPVIIEQCEHIICRNCFLTQRAQSLECVVPWCKVRNGIAPLNLDDCTECQDWNNNFRQPSREKKVLLVRQSMIELIEDELRDLAEENKMFKMPHSQYRGLIKLWRKTLSDYEGQYHRWYDLAALLDPFRGATVLKEDVKKQYPKALLRPMPREPDRGYIKCSKRSAQEFPDGIEPWISTVLRTVFAREHKQYDRYARLVDYHRHGEFLNRHIKNYENQDFDEHGNYTGEDWPVKRIVSHRFTDNGEMEYQVQFLGFSLPQDLEWKTRDAVAPAAIRKYDAEVREARAQKYDAIFEESASKTSTFGSKNKPAVIADNEDVEMTEVEDTEFESDTEQSTIDSDADLELDETDHELIDEAQEGWDTERERESNEDSETEREEDPTDDSDNEHGEDSDQDDDEPSQKDANSGDITETDVSSGNEDDDEEEDDEEDSVIIKEPFSDEDAMDVDTGDETDDSS